MNFSFIFATILSQLLIFYLSLQCLSTCSSSHHNVACPVSLVTTCLTFLYSSTSSYSKCLSRALIQSRSSSTSRFPSYMGISIFSLAPILVTALNRRSSTTSLTVTSSPFPTSFSLSASLISLVSTVRFYPISMASILARSSRISLSTARSGISLSLLLGSMAEKYFFFLCYRKKIIFSCSDTK
jgi:hypothetical protein